VDGIYVIPGLRRIVGIALTHLAEEDLSFLLEMHPLDGRTPLGVHADLFDHWRDTTNAERMNFWLDNLIQNAALLEQAYQEATARLRPQRA